MKKYILPLLFITPLLAGCMTESQNVYEATQVGQSSLVEFGTVLQTRQVTIKAENSGVGTVAGGVAGAGAGSAIGGGDGAIYAAIGGALVGAVAGTVAEEQLMKDTGIEYTIATEKGRVMTVVQNQKKDEPIFAKGTRVMVQTSGSYQRVLSADNIPTSMKRPQGVKMID